VVLLYFIAAFVVIVPVLGVPLLAYGPARRVARSRVAASARAAVGGLVATLGRPAAALAVLLASTAAVVAVFWPLGILCHRLEDAVDFPVWSWVTDRRDPSFEDVNWFYTALGDRYPLKWVTVVAAVVFAVLWRRRFWVPLVGIPLAFVVEQYTQAVVSGMVDRGHPPTGLGSYPSGGVARIDMTIGAVALFVALTWRLSRGGRVALATVVLTLAAAEAYSRIYVQKHWLTDVLAGYLFGPALFLGYAAAIVTLIGIADLPDTPEKSETARALEVVR